MKPGIVTVPIHRFEDGAGAAAQDLISVEEPLQIRLGERDIAITMRTPGNERELAAGFLFTEGILHSRDQMESISVDDRGTVTIHPNKTAIIDWESAPRNFYVTSSCGVCGKASIDALRATGCTALPKGWPQVETETLASLPAKLRSSQAVFEHTGGLHAAGLFAVDGALLEIREDVGRHNAVDKLIGWALLESRLPLDQHILMLSGRISFELVQKALMAKIPVIAAIGAPSSLAVETARRFGITLVGFLRDEHFNVYSEPSRIRA